MTDLSRNSFMRLVEVHEQLDELFLSHQEALLIPDLKLATEILDCFESELRSHMADEEGLLLPVYERADRIPGGPVEFFTGEHRKMLQLLEQIRTELATIGPMPTRREVIRLIDEENKFKQLVQHHDERERNILYPTLDKVTTEDERRRLLKQCSIPSDDPV